MLISFEQYYDILGTVRLVYTYNQTIIIILLCMLGWMTPMHVYLLMDNPIVFFQRHIMNNAVYYNIILLYQPQPQYELNLVFITL